MAKVIEINGEQFTVDEAMGFLKMIYKDAYKIAGVFHGMDRSAKFRVNWPDEYKFADANWKTFVVHCREMYTERLADPKTPEPDKRKMFLAMVLERRVAEGQETDSRLQLSPNTLQFEGDKRENAKIVETYGTNPNLRAALMNSTATRH